MSACLVSYRPLGWEPFGFSKRATRSFQPPRRRLCAFPTPRPGPRQRAPTTSEPRTTRSDLLARDTPPTRCGGRGWRGFGGRSGCCCINAGQSDLAYVGREYGAIGLQQASRSMALSCLGWDFQARLVGRARGALNSRVFFCFPTTPSFFRFFTLPDVGECSQTSVVLLLGWSSWL